MDVFLLDSSGEAAIHVEESVRGIEIPFLWGQIGMNEGTDRLNNDVSMEEGVFFKDIHVCLYLGAFTRLRSSTAILTKVANMNCVGKCRLA